MTPESLRVLGALRRMAQALDSHSKHLENSVDLTVPQVLVLEALRPESEPLSAGPLAERVGLSQGTVTSILDRLEDKRLVRRTRASDDRRRVMVSLTDKGRGALSTAPPLLHACFVQQFEALPVTERTALVEALERLAGLMRTPPALQLPPAA